jgi:hypothetical protein
MDLRNSGKKLHTAKKFGNFRLTSITMPFKITWLFGAPP